MPALRRTDSADDEKSREVISMSLDDFGFSDYWITGDPNMLAPDIRKSGSYEKCPYDPAFEEMVRENSRYGNRSIKRGDE
jgi:hypothetical protein